MNVPNSRASLAAHLTCVTASDVGITIAAFVAGQQESPDEDEEAQFWALILAWARLHPGIEIVKPPESINPETPPATPAPATQEG